MHRNYTLICRAGSPSDTHDDYHHMLAINIEYYPVISHPAAEIVAAFELNHVTRERVGLHLFESGKDAIKIGDGKLPQPFLRSISEMDDVGHGAVD